MILYNKGIGSKDYSLICQEYLEKLMVIDPNDPNKELFIPGSVFRNVQDIQNDTSANKKLQKLAIELAKHDFALLRNIITCLPDKFEELHDKQIRSLLERLKITKNGSYRRGYRDKIQVFFAYDKFNYTINRNWWYDILHIPICPYCNINPIYKYGKSQKNEDLIMMDIEHFMPKSRFPLFSMSFYNLVPSCFNCNLRLKRLHTLPSTHIHPYLDSFHQEAKFTFDPHPFLFNKDKHMMKLGLIPRNVSAMSKSSESIKDFRFTSAYKPYISQITNLIHSYQKKYKPRYLYNITDLSKDNNIKLFNDEDDIDIYKETSDIPKNEDDIRKIVIGKMKYDFYQALESYET